MIAEKVTTSTEITSGSELPLCPPAYDYTKTTYISGQLVEIKEDAFQCNEKEEYEIFCNIPSLWKHAWVDVGPCASSAFPTPNVPNPPTDILTDSPKNLPTDVSLFVGDMIICKMTKLFSPEAYH